MISLLFFLVGAVIGSFLNVCIYRLPRGESINHPSSHCPKCLNPIKPYDNIPIISFFLLGGRCRYCKGPISWQYPLVEFANAIIYLFNYHYWGLKSQTLIFCFLESALIVVFVIDLKHKIIPNVITIPWMFIGLAASSFKLIEGMNFKNSIVGLIACGGGLWIFGGVMSRIIGQEAMGGGDFKFMAMMGAFVGWIGGAMIIVFASFLGLMVSIPILVALRLSRRTQVPFGPFLVVASFIVLTFKNEIINWYINLYYL